MAGAAAEVVVAIHLVYLLYVPLGGLLGLRDVRWLWPHSATVVWGVVGVLTGARCPLTELEKHLVALDGGEPYSGPFIDRYLADVLYPAELQDLVWWLTSVVVLASYLLVFSRLLGGRRLAPP